MAQLLMGAAAALTREIAPHLENNPTAKARAGALGLILACAAQEADSGAETLIREQDALRALLLEASHMPLGDEALLTQLAQAGRDESRPSLKVTDLEAQNGALMGLLGALLAHVEAINFDWAETLEARIWRLLKAGAERRALYLPVL